MRIKRGVPREAKQDEWVAIDLEMFGQREGRLHRPHGTFACLSIAYSGKEVYQISDLRDLRSTMDRISRGRWIMQNAAYDLRQLRAFYPISQRQVWDTMLVEQGLFSGWYSDFGLDHLVRRWLGEVMEKQVRSDFGKRKDLTREMERYAARDATATWRVAEAQRNYIAAEDVTMDHYWKVDEPCLWAVIDMPPAKINVKKWLELAEHHERTGQQIEDELGFNVYSGKEVKKALETELGMRLKDTKGKDTLEPLYRGLVMSGKHRGAEMVQRILDARRYRKAASTYGASWVDQHVEKNGLVYPDYRINGTRTCRFSCSNPNLQNIPAREMPVFRSLFKSSYGGLMYVADMSQQEPRILAWFSEDTRLRDDLLSNVDLHQQAADDFGLSRREGKDINLGLGYGMSEWGLAARTGLTKKEAREGIRKRNLRYPGVRTWNDRVQRKAASFEYVKTSMGRRLWVNTYDNQWDRHAINFPIQGTAAEQTKLWLVLCHQRALEAGMPFRIPLAVHDELVADTKRGEGRFWRSLVLEAGRDSGEIVVPGFPMELGLGVGKSWAAKS